MSWPSIDHSILSPNGRVSERTRNAMLKRVSLELFGPEGLQKPSCPSTPESTRENLISRAQFLEGLADAGMRPKAHRREAAKLRAEAEAHMKTFWVATLNSNYRSPVNRDVVISLILEPFYADAARRLSRLSAGLTDSITTPHHIVTRRDA